MGGGGGLAISCPRAQKHLNPPFRGDKVGTDGGVRAVLSGESQSLGFRVGRGRGEADDDCRCTLGVVFKED